MYGFSKKMEGSKYSDPAGSCSCCTNDPTNDAGRFQLLRVANGVSECTGQKFETAENDVYILAVARGKTVEQCVDICRNNTYCLGAYFLRTGTDGQGSTCKSLARVQVTSTDTSKSPGLFPHPSKVDDVSYAKDGAKRLCCHAMSLPPGAAHPPCVRSRPPAVRCGAPARLPGLSAGLPRTQASALYRARRSRCPRRAAGVVLPSPAAAH